jgi:hypothetical protein
MEHPNEIICQKVQTNKDQAKNNPSALPSIAITDRAPAPVI